MPYDEPTAARVRQQLARRKGLEVKKMFGGVGFLLRGNMCVGVWKESLILRVGPDAYEDALAEPFTREFDITGRPMTGWIMLEPDGFADDRDLSEWVGRAVEFVKTLPTR
jgi:TfoX/Sxy family transcriptional regulator of competence genes